MQYRLRHSAFLPSTNATFWPLPPFIRLPLSLSPPYTYYRHRELLSCAPVASDWLLGEEDIIMAHTGGAGGVVD